MIPIANIPLLEYLIDYLLDNNIEELFILYTVRNEKLIEHVRSQHYKSKCNLKIHLINCMTANSVGAALRLMADSREFQAHCVDQDFVVLRGDIVTNVPLENAIKAHLERKAANKKCWITKTFITMCHSNRLRAREDDIVLVTDPSEKLLLQYNTLSNSEKLKLPGCVVPPTGSLEVRYDLYDCRIDICSSELLNYLKDNFDFKDLQEGFIQHLNAPDSFVEGKAFYYEYNDPKGAYCAVVQNPLIYDYVSRDLIKRYAYPLVIDSNLMSPGYTLTYKYIRGNIYIEDNTHLAMTCVITPNTVIGQHSEVGDGAVLDASTLGRGCVIGARARICGSYLWDNVTVEEDCVITGAILCEKVTVRKGTTVSPGSILDAEVRCDRETRLRLS